MKTTTGLSVVPEGYTTVTPWIVLRESASTETLADRPRRERRRCRPRRLLCA
jgi:hypothetical protein